MYPWLESLVKATLTSFIAMIMVSAVSKLVVNERRLQEIQEEIARWENMKRDAVERKDRKAYLRIMRGESRIRRLREEIEKSRIKSMTASMLTWMGFFALLNNSNLITQDPFIYFPLTGGKIGFSSWYFIVSLWMFRLAGALTSKLIDAFRK